MTLRDRFAAKLGISEQRKADIYVELSRSTTLTDPSYWMQTLFAAAIATLGLVLNSPAVIIGAMLISPLMGPILASGLALATGDVILGMRAGLNLALSCLLAVVFALLLVTILPFKEITNEIAVRTHPTTLDLAVAFFSGAVGSIATCKEVKGVVTSIPGVAIAVALMPPLGVVGYGAALAFSPSHEEGLQVAMGGGLLFLTNLVAITFTAMIVFLALHIDAPAVQKQMEDWHKTDRESIRLRKVFRRLPGVPGVRHIGTLPARLFMVLLIILIILIPLSRSFNQLRQELSNQQRENRIRRVVTQTWQKQFGKLSNGDARSYLDHVAVIDQNGKLTLQLRVLTTQPLDDGEKQKFKESLATALSRSPQSLQTQVIEIPTASVALRSAAEAQPPPPASAAELQAAFLDRLDDEFSHLLLPEGAKLLTYQIANMAPNEIDVTLTYISERDIEVDAQSIIEQDVRKRLDSPNATVKLIRIPISVGQLAFRNSASAIDRAGQQTLDKAAEYLTQFPKLRLEITSGQTQSPDQVAEERLANVREYLQSKWKISMDRVELSSTASNNNAWSLSLTTLP